MPTPTSKKIDEGGLQSRFAPISLRAKLIFLAVFVSVTAVTYGLISVAARKRQLEIDKTKAEKKAQRKRENDAFEALPSLPNAVPPSASVTPPHMEEQRGGVTFGFGGAPATTPTTEGQVVIGDGGQVVIDRSSGKEGSIPPPSMPAGPGDTIASLPVFPQGSGVELSNLLQPYVMECAKAIPAASLGKNPLVQPSFFVNIASEKLTVASISLATRDVQADARDPLRACIREKSVGKTLDVKGAKDIQDYPVHVPYFLKK